MRKAVIVTVCIAAVVGGGLSVADSKARDYAEEDVAEEIQDRLGLADPPDVDIEGWPFTLNAAQGSIPAMRISEEQTAIDGQSISGIVIHATDVDFDSDSVHVGRARGRVELSGADLTSMIRKQGYRETIEIDGEIITASRGRMSASSTAESSLKGNRLTVVPSTNEVKPFSFDLPEVIPDIRYTSVEVRDSLALVSFTARNVDLAEERLR